MKYFIILTVIAASTAFCRPLCAGTNYALLFDGAEDKVRIPHHSSLSFPDTSRYTIEFWMKLTDTSSDHHILGKRESCASVNYQVAKTSTHANIHWSASTGNKNQFMSTNFAPIPNAWTHFAFSYDGDTMSIYVNGTLDNKDTITTGDENTADLMIGTSSDCAGLFIGEMDEVRIWNIARSSSEITNSYDVRLNPTESGLIGYWNFDEDSLDQVVLDISPVSNHGTRGLDISDATDDPQRVTSTAPTGCCILAGDFNHDGTFNISDITAGIARIFAGGPAPACQDEADSNGDNAYNISDITYGIARIFAGGSAPVCGSTGS